MKKIDKNAKFGKIIQITKGIRFFLNSNYIVLQTFGQPLDGTVLCADKYGLKTVLLSDIGKDIVIFSISTITVDEEIIRWMRMFTFTGRNVFVFTFEVRKLWYCDELVSKSV